MFWSCELLVFLLHWPCRRCLEIRQLSFLIPLLTFCNLGLESFGTLLRMWQHHPHRQQRYSMRGWHLNLVCWHRFSLLLTNSKWSKSKVWNSMIDRNENKIMLWTGLILFSFYKLFYFEIYDIIKIMFVLRTNFKLIYDFIFLRNEYQIMIFSRIWRNWLCTQKLTRI